MTNFVIDDEKHAIHYRSAVVTFDGFESYKEQALAIADYINSVELTEDNVAQVKADLAAARKVTDGLNRKRIDIKNEVMKSTKEFEEQVKELCGIISEAENGLRSKVRELDEKERDLKKENIRTLWDKRVQMYGNIKMIPDAFMRFLVPQYLNKSTPYSQIERGMVQWLEAKDRDIEVMKAMGDEYLVDYVTTLDTTQTIANIKTREAVQQTIEEVQEEYEPKHALPTAVFMVTGTANIELTERLLKENGIDYKRR